MFSNFSDRQKYNSAIPTGQYFQQVFVTMSNYIAEFTSQMKERNGRSAGYVFIQATISPKSWLSTTASKCMYDGLFPARPLSILGTFDSRRMSTVKVMRSADHSWRALLSHKRCLVILCQELLFWTCQGEMKASFTRSSLA